MLTGAKRTGFGSILLEEVICAIKTENFRFVIVFSMSGGFIPKANHDVRRDNFVNLKEDHARPDRGHARTAGGPMQGL